MIAAVVLAAGLSRRMGTQKLLLPFAGRTVIAHIIDQLQSARMEAIHVVVGADGARVAAALAGRPVTLVPNPDPEGGGMLSSVRCGLASLPAECAAALIVLGDQPALTPETVVSVIQAFDSAAQRIIVPIHGGRRGHPLLIPRCFFSEIQTRFDDAGLRGLLQAHPNQIHELELSNTAVLSDMDTPADYQRELDRLEQECEKGGGPCLE